VWGLAGKAEIYFKKFVGFRTISDFNTVGTTIIIIVQIRTSFDAAVVVILPLLLFDIIFRQAIEVFSQKSICYRL